MPVWASFTMDVLLVFACRVSLNTVREIPTTPTLVGTKMQNVKTKTRDSFMNILLPDAFSLIMSETREIRRINNSACE